MGSFGCGSNGTGRGDARGKPDDTFNEGADPGVGERSAQTSLFGGVCVAEISVSNETDGTGPAARGTLVTGTDAGVLSLLAGLRSAVSKGGGGLSTDGASVSAGGV